MTQIRYERTTHNLTLAGNPAHTAVSIAAMTLMYTLAAALIDLCAAGQITEPGARLRPGDAHLHCRSSHLSRGAVLLTFDTIARGLALLAEKYPEEISYEEK